MKGEKVNLRVSHSASSGCPELDLPGVIFTGAFFQRKSSCPSSFHCIDRFLHCILPAEIIDLLQ